MHNTDPIKQANRKALPKFILFTLLCTALGGVVGFCGAAYGVEGLATGLQGAGRFFADKAAPWLLAAAVIALPAVCLPLYLRAAKLFAGWDGEDEEGPNTVERRIERMLSLVIWLTGSFVILDFFLITAVYAGGLAALEGRSSVPLLLSVLCFAVVMVEAVLLQQKCIDLTKKLYPEKSPSIYDMKFQKKWMENCDEAERAMIAQCAYKAYAATNTTCVILIMVLALGALLFGIGFLPTLAVCVVWGVNQTVYCLEAMKH